MESKRSATSLERRFVVPVASVILGVVLGSALLLAWLQLRRTNAEVEAAFSERSDSLSRMLEGIDGVMAERVDGSLKLMWEEARSLGAPARGDLVTVGTQQVPDLVFGTTSQHDDFALVDKVTELVGGTATLFTLRGSDYVRLSTNVKSDGGRAVGTLLDAKGKAYAALAEGRGFRGMVDILGKPYFTAYDPMRDAQGVSIGAWYVGYPVETKSVRELIAGMRILERGFVALVDASGKVRFHSDSVSDEVAQSVSVGNADGWRVRKTAYPSWNYTIVAAASTSEIHSLLWGSVLGILLGGVMASVLMVYVVTRLLKRLVLAPLGGEPEDATAAARRIALGELTREVTAARWDSTSLLAAMRDMQEGLRGMVREIRRGARRLLEASSTVAQTSADATSNSTKLHGATQAIAGTLQELAASVQVISDSARNAGSLADEAGRTSSSGSKVVRDIVEGMKNSAGGVIQAAERIATLEQSSQRISAVANVIKEIAQQTNLLALNAAVEAARAGEAGRGFAVVAGEVRHLAERSSSATREIALMIQEIQEHVRASVLVIGASAQQVNTIAQQAGAAVDSMDIIQGATERLVRAVAEISSALQEQSAASSHIAAQVERVVQTNEESEHLLQEVTAEVEGLTSLSEELTKAVSRFQVAE